MGITYPPEMLPSPDDGEEADVIADCECCGKKRSLSRCWTTDGIETFSCDECRGS